MAAFDPLFLVFLIPLFDSCIFPWLKRHGYRTNPIRRMTFGFCLASAALFIACGIQAGIYASGTFQTCPTTGQVQFQLNPNNPGVNVFAQVPVYFFIAVSEIFASITSLEFAYSEAPASMKSIIMAFSLFQTALGSLLGLALTPIVTEQNFMWLFMSFAIAMLVFAAGFYVAFRGFYQEKEL
jgi:POT family proton-dependent oligopeptide transporter